MTTFSTYLTRPEEKLFFGAMKKTAGVAAQRDLHALGLMRDAGLRVGTLCGLTVRDAQNALAVSELQLRDEISKGRKGYAVPLTRDIEKHLRSLLALRRELKLGLDPDAPLIASRKGGEPMTPRGVQHRVKVWRKTAGLQVAVTPHWLRHTLGQRIVRESSYANPLGAAQQALGHRSLTSTGIYTKPNREEIRNAMQEASS